MIRIDWAWDGSSPRLRGTRGQASPRWNIGRFIPAPAGNARPRWEQLGSRPVHPRACGEREPRCWVCIWCGGSSPRLRGTRLSDRLHHVRRRFIPAPAGNASRGFGWRCSNAVHPRACGERYDAGDLQLTVGGSSPRLRGTRGRHRSHPRVPRFIPAPAGNAAARCWEVVLATVHPRACGERAGPPVLPQRDHGSSPRLRGTRPLVRLVRRDQRFIPAPAGNA